MSSAASFVTPYMFLGAGLTSSVIQAAGEPTAGVNARPKVLVVLVKTNALTPFSTAASSKFSVPEMFVSTNACRWWVPTWGL